MTVIPEAYQRILEHRVESIVARQLSSIGPMARWLFYIAFSSDQLSMIESVTTHVDRDHRPDSGDPLAYGETDIEVIGRIPLAGASAKKVGLLVEMKVDARQGKNQGLRYQARALHRQRSGCWDDFRCVLVAPQGYLENAYPLSDHEDAGWDSAVSLEEVGQRLRRIPNGEEDATVVIQSTQAANSWNKPIPEAAQFWRDLARFQRAIYPDVPIFINRQQGAGLFVWPSFYENQLASNPHAIRRKRVQIVHSGKTHVALFIKKVKAGAFDPVVRPLLGEGIRIGDPGGAWQSLRISVPYVNPQQPLETQVDAISNVFGAARRLYDFFLKHEDTLLRIPTFK